MSEQARVAGLGAVTSGGRAGADGGDAGAREVEAFVATVCHDLRSPVIALDGFVAALRQVLAGVELPETAELILDRMAVNTAFLAVLTGDLLALAGSNEVPDDPAVCDPADVARDVAHALAAQHPGGRLVLEGPLPAVRVPTVRLRQVLTNLMANAYAYAGHRDVTVTITGAREHDEAVLWVHDDGVGIPAEQRDGVFAAFARMGRTRDSAGSGLGLAICRRICERHGGRIHVVDRERGACFEVRLPAG